MLSAGRWSKSDLMKKIREDNGSGELTTVEGGKLWLAQDGKHIMLKDGKGGTSTITIPQHFPVQRCDSHNRHGGDAQLADHRLFRSFINRGAGQPHPSNLEPRDKFLRRFASLSWRPLRSKAFAAVFPYRLLSSRLLLYVDACRVSTAAYQDNGVHRPNSIPPARLRHCPAQRLPRLRSYPAAATLLPLPVSLSVFWRGNGQRLVRRNWPRTRLGRSFYSARRLFFCSPLPLLRRQCVRGCLFCCFRRLRPDSRLGRRLQEKKCSRS